MPTYVLGNSSIAVNMNGRVVKPLKTVVVFLPFNSPYKCLPMLNCSHVAYRGVEMYIYELRYMCFGALKDYTGV